MRAPDVRRLVALIALALVACGGPSHPSRPTIEDLRRRAAERPDDPDAQRALAEGELLLEGGDPSRAAAQIERASQLAPGDLRLRYLAASEQELHGSLSAALDGYLAVVAGAAQSDDPLAPALAAVSAAEIESLDDAVPNYAERVEEALAPVHAAPGSIGDEARSTIADLLVDIAFRRADVARVAALVDAQRCIDTWRVAGPFGPRHLLAYDTQLAPDADATLADAYDLGPSRGRRETRSVQARGCHEHLGGGPAAGSGTTFAEATFDVPTAGRWVLRVETPNSVQLFIDGEPLAALDRRHLSLPGVTYHEATLTAGEHRIRARVTTRHPNPVLVVSLSQTPGAVGGGAIEGESLLAAFIRAQHAMVRGDTVRARELLRSHLGREGSPVFLVAGAAATLNDPLRGQTERHDDARRLLEWASDRDEAAWYPRLALAQLEANQGRSQAAIDALRAGMERWPELVVLPLQLIDYLTARGWHAQVAEAVAAARRAVPTACRPRRAAMAHAMRRSRAAEVLEHARELVACDARSDAMLTLHVQRREWAEASAELRRLATLEPEDGGLAILRADLELATARGDDDAVGALLESLRERLPRSSDLVLREADRILARGDQAGARAHLATALTTEPEAMMELRRPLRAIGGESPIEAYRRDGAEVIRALEASGRVYEEPMVLVLDYTVYRVFEDGSMLELTHNIMRLSSQEAVDAQGEFAVPEDAQMLTLHTIKADGTRLEPDEIAGKDTISFPNLSPGDYIEFEYVRPRPAPAGYPGGFVGDRFYFQSFETPFDTSELTVVVPSSMELQVDPRGPAPETQTRTADGTRVYHWGVSESRPLTQEPGSVAAREFLPSIYWGRGVSWAQYVETLRDVLADRDVIDPAARRLVRTVVGDASRATAEQRAERLYRWVLENVEDTDDVFGLAPAMLAARNGNRARVLRYLLEIAGLDAQLALARSYATDATRSEMADDDTYQHLLVRVRGTEGWIWLHTGARGSPFGYLPRPLAGMDALVLDASAAEVRVTERALEEDLRTIEVDVELRRDGGARVTVVETQRGAYAVSWRNDLEEIPDEALETQFESQYVASLLPGAELRRLVITGREDPDAPLVLRYEVELAQLARQSRDGWVLPPLFRARLAPQFASAASRTTAQLIPTGLALDVVVRVDTPEGVAAPRAPEAVTLDSVHGATMRMTSSAAPGELTVRREYRIPRMRVAPAEYAPFTRFCRASDDADSGELRVAM
ncbi:MAG: DUF3857 domain-containing protein [Sandaracinaceae bacterium]|nr:DUF3857 domain-containing protein [Sandaracinaceae bacterium]